MGVTTPVQHEGLSVHHAGDVWVFLAICEACEVVGHHQLTRLSISALGGGLRQAFAQFQVEVNEEKSRRVDRSQGGSFGYLGFEFRRVRSRAGRGTCQ